MALHIKNPETDRLLARGLAEATGESIAVATRTAIEQRLVRECTEEQHKRFEAIMSISDRVSTLPWKYPGKHPEKSPKEMMEELYDENGLPE